MQILRYFPSVKPIKFRLLSFLATNFRKYLLSVLLNSTPGQVEYVPVRKKIQRLCLKCVSDGVLHTKSLL